MSERGREEPPIVPRRTLGSPGTTTAPATAPVTASATGSDTSGARPMGERLSRAVSSAGAALSSASSGPTVRTAEQPTVGTRVNTNSPRVRRARLRVTHIDPWSVMKTAFLLSVAVGVVTVVAVAVVWMVLGVAGVWDSINSTVLDVVGNDSSTAFDIRDYLGTGRVMGFTMLVAVVDVILITAIATLGAFLYNLSAALLGGVEVTLSEGDR